ncbi:hypothetical protein KBD45_06780 [Candidatus Dojkabacteria bacterium]|nr:hypothetical protein [Candidatus Dojkabacteria bacterium]
MPPIEVVPCNLAPGQSKYLGRPNPDGSYEWYKTAEDMAGCPNCPLFKNQCPGIEVINNGSQVDYMRRPDLESHQVVSELPLRPASELTNELGNGLDLNKIFGADGGKNTISITWEQRRLRTLQASLDNWLRNRKRIEHPNGNMGSKRRARAQGYRAAIGEAKGAIASLQRRIENGDNRY